MQQRRRVKISAARQMTTFLILLLQRNVFDLKEVSELPEVRRLRFLTRAVRKAARGEKVLLMLLMLDVAVRCPSYTAQIATLLARWPAKWSPESVGDAALQTLKKSMHVTFWRGRALQQLRTFLPKWTGTKLAKAAMMWPRRSARARGSKQLAAAMSLPGIGMYLGGCMVRQVSAAGIGQGGACGHAAMDMSAHVSLLHAVCNFRSMRGALVKAGLSHTRSWSWDMLSLLYCEGTKVLQEAGVLRGVGHYRKNLGELFVDLGGPEMRWLLRRLSESAPLIDGPHIC